MKNQILYIVGELGLALPEELRLVLAQHFGGLNEGTFDENLRELEGEGALFRLLPGENSLNQEGFILGPEARVGESYGLKRLMVENGLAYRGEAVNWGTFSARLLEGTMGEVRGLREDILKRYEDPKRLEMRYFDLSLRYHAIYGFFFERCDPEFLAPYADALRECREYLAKMQP